MEDGFRAGLVELGVSDDAGGTRPLFDPSKMAASGTRRAEETNPWTVAELAAAIGSTLSRHMPAKVRVVGEISNFTERTHWYFALKDSASLVNAVMFASSARRARFVPRAGQQVVVSGKVEFYEKLGRVTLIVESMEPVGAGALELALRALVEEIRGLGWLDEGRKRRLPGFPRRVAVITSRTGAALQDVLDTARRRCAAVEWVVCDVRVQGEGSAAEIAAMVRQVSAWRQDLGIDAILLTRGGGSIEDLWSFNDKEVARAIVESAVPVVAAIGHETDTTIAELVADVRAATPTQAAMRLTPDAVALVEQLSALGSRAEAAIRRAIDRGRELELWGRRMLAPMAALLSGRAAALERLSARVERHRPVAVLERRLARVIELERRLGRLTGGLASRDVDGLGDRLRAAIGRRVAAERARVVELEREVQMVGPPSVLNRGYSYTRRADGRLVRSMADVEAGVGLRTRVADGEIASTVDGATRAEPIQDRKSMPRRRRGGPEGPGLFG